MHYDGTIFLFFFHEKKRRFYNHNATEQQQNNTQVQVKNHRRAADFFHFFFYIITQSLLDLVYNLLINKHFPFPLKTFLQKKMSTRIIKYYHHIKVLLYNMPSNSRFIFYEQTHKPGSTIFIKYAVGKQKQRC